MLLNDYLAKKYDYKPLSEKQSVHARYIYKITMPPFLVNTEQPLFTAAGTLICSKFDRVVIGDYGAYVEFSSECANKDEFIIAPGQEYRLEPRYNNVKYIWLTTKDDSGIKIYYQKNTVKYADYLPHKYYVSVFEVYPEYVVDI